MTHGEVVDITQRLDRSAARVGAPALWLDPAELAAFASWCREAGVSPADDHLVLRHLVLRLVADPELAADVRGDLREGRTAEDVARYIGW